MLRQAQDFRGESDALHALVAPLSEAELRRPTAFKGWTIDTVIGHLHMWNVAADLSLREPAEFQRLFAELNDAVGGGATLSEFEARWLDGLAGRELVRTWHEFCAVMAEHFGEADPALRVKWAGPDMSVRSSITARLMETWAHGQEVYDVLGEVRSNTDRIHNIVVLGVNTYGWTFNVRNEEPPQPMPYLKLDAPSGEVWRFGEVNDVERIEGSAEEFCQVVTQVRNIADTALRVTGPNATRWMALAQCFAGAASTPPEPGTRRRVDRAAS